MQPWDIMQLWLREKSPMKEVTGEDTDSVTETQTVVFHEDWGQMVCALGKMIMMIIPTMVTVK